MSEVFPYKTRGTATGLTAALNYVLSFIATKTYYNLESSLSLPGVALFNCIIIAIGLVLMLYILPETENRTLEEIELHFADNNKKITDLKIAKIHSTQNGHEMSNGFTAKKPFSVIGYDEVAKKRLANRQKIRRLSVG